MPMTPQTRSIKQSLALSRHKLSQLWGVPALMHLLCWGLASAWFSPAIAQDRMTHDDLNRLQSLEFQDGRRLSYVYDAAGNLIRTIKDGSNGNWCGQSLDFNGGVLPRNWSAEVIRGGPGLINDRLEGRPTDSGIHIRSSVGVVPRGTQRVLVSFRSSRTYSFWGQQTLVAFADESDQRWEFVETMAGHRMGLGRREFAASLNGEVMAILEVPGDFGEFDNVVELSPGQVDWRLTDDAGNTSGTALPVPGFKPSQLRTAEFRIYTTTDGSIWGDDLRFECLR